jgi:hypothetical protein
MIKASGLPHLVADNGTLTLNMRMQALAIHSGNEGALHHGTSLHNHLSFHHMFDRAELAEVTCVAEWESGFIMTFFPALQQQQGLISSMPQGKRTLPSSGADSACQLAALTCYPCL